MVNRPSLSERLRQSRERSSSSVGSPSSATGSTDPARAPTTNSWSAGSRSGTVGSGVVPRTQDPAVSSDRTRSSIAGRPQTRDRTSGIRGPGGLSARGENRPAAVTWQQHETRVEQAEARHQTLGSRLMEHRQRLGTPSTWSGGHDSGSRVSLGVQAGTGAYRPLYLHGRYYDRPDLIRYGDRHIHTYYDPYQRLHHRIIWPTYYYPVYYPFGAGWHLDYVYPYYHRKYVFTSLGGWWPYDYTYRRYYWYGYHPYVWYGYYPVAREVVVGSDNYYTYNYNFYDEDGNYTTYSSSTPLEATTQAEVQARLQQRKAAEPAPQTLADTRFDEGVKSFEAGDYATAGVKFDEAMRLAPKDMILPFALAQVLFADGDYRRAAEVLRVALKEVTPEKEGVFFPRGLYANDEVLYGQIDKLLDKADQAGDDSDLQLLLGYQLLGVGETGYAREQLEQARQDPKNAASAGTLLNVVEKMEKEAGSAVKTGGTETPKPEAPAAKANTATRATLEKKLSAPRTGTADDAQATASPKAPAQSTPLAPAEPAPATPPQNKPEEPQPKPRSADQEPTGTVSTSNRAGTQDAKGLAENTDPAQEMDQPADPADNDDGVVMGPQSDNEVVVEKAGFLDRSAGIGLVPGLSRLLNRRVPNYKVDIAIFASILSLALAGLWVEWRLPGRRPV